MKKLFLLGLVTLLFVACQQEQRYFAESAEIETLKAGIAAYEGGDWEQWASHFAEDAKIFVNSTDSMTVDERLAELTEMSGAWGDYGFDKENEFVEMVIDKEKETWVYYWATHNGTVKATGKKLALPVHLAVQFEDGKIKQEHVYFDASELNAEMSKIQNSEDMYAAAMNAQNTVVKAWNTFDADLFRSISTTDVKRFTNGVQGVASQDEYVGFMTVFHTAFPDFNVVVTDSHAKDGKLYSMWTVTGTHTGDFMGNAPTGKSITTHGISIWTLNADGKLTQEDAFYDNMTLYQQLGISQVPPVQ